MRPWLDNDPIDKRQRSRRRKGSACTGHGVARVVGMSPSSLHLGAVLAVAVASTAALEHHASQPRGEEKLIFEQKLVTVPGRQLAALTVDYTPGGVSPAHHHGEDVEVFAYVVFGSVRSKVNDGAETVYRAGEFWYEPPGSAHSVSVNASSEEPARILAVFVAADGARLTTVDP
jgi:quercetin dioxygenase-like cupin family protein